MSSVVLCLGVLTVTAEEYEITRSTIDGGGVMRSTGDAYELSGTIGQPDAGVMAGGEFELTGGFWFALAPTDCNDDGGVDLADYDAFEACLSGPDRRYPRRMRMLRRRSKRRRRFARLRRVAGRIHRDLVPFPEGYCCFSSPLYSGGTEGGWLTPKNPPPTPP